MTDPKPPLREINPDRPLTDAAREEVAALARRQSKAGGVLMQAINFVGGQVEDGLKLLPKSTRAQLDAAARVALERSYHAASQSRTGAGQSLSGGAAHRAMATLSGAIGGLGGLPTALLELPVATTLIFRAVQEVAEAHGEDPTSMETRIECLRVFGAGGPGGLDDGVDTSFLGARISLTGAAVHGLIGKVAPRFAAVLSQKLASQAVPVLGAAAGAGTNFAFIRYYTEVAHVHFGLRQLARLHNEAEVTEAFHRELARLTTPVLRGK
ncbi:protein EcsC [Loktanella sp. IMCC34160]|uniref:EcsC family protein n=1 Tax=Loktanella sp. IMCC34160 TaxID=2510646 RepID=UPI00101BDF08|nr:EcsC family protein [Loktanella sp. IMCC34160]RYG90356.1 protein EcsC [Loktanella sp. IMCC34160]